MLLQTEVSMGRNGLNQVTGLTWTGGNQMATITGSVNPDETVVVEYSVDDGPRQPIIADAEGLFSVDVDLGVPGASWQQVKVSVFGTITGAGFQGTDAVAQEDVILSVPPGVSTPGYDLDGNLNTDGQWDYLWNARNQLASMTRSQAWLDAGHKPETLTFEYDAEGRRIYKSYTRWDEVDGVIEVDREHRFVWENWNLLAEEISEGTEVWMRYYTWGLDVSNTRLGAGGVGGLLGIRDGKLGRTLLPIYDGRGNVIAVVDGQTRETLAEWDFGPFGEPLLAKGDPEILEACAFGFATKYTDAETGLAYFGHRYLDPMTGRWLSREPLGEGESKNLYAYCHNDPIGKVDYLGLDEIRMDSWENRFWSSIHVGADEVGKSVGPYADVIPNLIYSIPWLAGKGVDAVHWGLGGGPGIGLDEWATRQMDPSLKQGLYSETKTTYLVKTGTGMVLGGGFGGTSSRISGSLRAPVTTTYRNASRAFPPPTPVAYALDDLVVRARAANAETGLFQNPLRVTADDYVLGFTPKSGQSPTRAQTVFPQQNQWTTATHLPAPRTGLSPSNFGLQTIAGDSRLLRMWNEALRGAASSRRSNGYTRYLEALERGNTVSTAMLEEAFDAVNSRFLTSARSAGYDVAQVHHWNFNKGSFPMQIVDSRHLVPTPSRAVHESIHRATTGNSSNIWQGPVAPENVILIPDISTLLAPF